MEPLRHIKNPKFGCVIFRRESTQIFNEGGLWDEATELYPIHGAKSNQTSATFTFPHPEGKRGGASVSFKHLQLEKDVLAFQGAQIALIGFDELTHFTKNQFWYMTSRSRSTSGVRPYIRASTNPDPDSWVAELIAWWIDQDELLPDGTSNPHYGLPIEERGGKLRYFLRNGNDFVWGDSAQEALDNLLAEQPFAEQTIEHVKSLTFIPAKLEDNKVLMEKDPGYKGNLLALDPVERARLLGGNWKTRAVAGMLFQRGWVTVVDEVPIEAIRIRYWDRAATAPHPGNTDPDWTRGVLLAFTPNGITWIEDVASIRNNPGEVEAFILATAEADAIRYPGIVIGIEQDPGQAGKADGANYIRLLNRFNVRLFPVSGKGTKVVRFSPFSAQASAGNVRVKRGLWNSAFFDELEAFPTPKVHDDQVDAVSGGYNAVRNNLTANAEPPVDRAAQAAAVLGPGLF